MRASILTFVVLVAFSVAACSSGPTSSPTSPTATGTQPGTGTAGANRCRDVDRNGSRLDGKWA